jgi:hypothetical protein
MIEERRFWVKLSEPLNETVIVIITDARRLIIPVTLIMTVNL